MKTNLLPVQTTSKTSALRLAAWTSACALMLLAFIGCKSVPGSGAVVDPTGEYSLVSVDGKNVPCDVKHGETPMTIQSGAFTINADGTCRSLMHFSVASHPAVSREVNATYARSGSELTMKWERAGVTKGKVEGDTFTMVNEGMTLVYRK
jgi:hypothetical protein